MADMAQARTAPDDLTEQVRINRERDSWWPWRAALPVEPGVRGHHRVAWLAPLRACAARLGQFAVDLGSEIDEHGPEGQIQTAVRGRWGPGS